MADWGSCGGSHIVRENLAQVVLLKHYLKPAPVVAERFVHATEPQRIPCAPKIDGNGMTIRAILSVAMGVALLTSGGCQQAGSMRDDLSRALSSPPTPQSRNARPVARTKATSVENTKPNNTEPPSETFVESAKPSTSEPSLAATDTAANPQAPTPPNEPAVQLAGKNENELRALLGAPTEELNQPPGKRWLYHDWQCTLYVQLFPDIQTKQFGTLSYAVKSDNDTDEGRRLCLAQFQSRVRARHP
jgi:hypothetical protein